MKRFVLIAAAALALSLSACGTTGGLTLGGAGSPIADAASFTNADLANAEAIALAHNDTLAAPCWSALATWLAAFNTGSAFTISGAASGFEAGRVVVNGINAGVPAYVYQGCGALYMQTHGQFLKALAGAATIKL